MLSLIVTSLKIARFFSKIICTSYLNPLISTSKDKFSLSHLSKFNNSLIFLPIMFFEKRVSIKFDVQTIFPLSKNTMTPI
jgi:hypothetical protein